jgi:hypothetical protein
MGNSASVAFDQDSPRQGVPRAPGNTVATMVAEPKGENPVHPKPHLVYTSCLHVAVQMPIAFFISYLIYLATDCLDHSSISAAFFSLCSRSTLPMELKLISSSSYEVVALGGTMGG